jgi:MtaA/CmuA family methyltransferase
MNSKQRCLAAIKGKPVDRVPVFPLLMFLAADRAGISYREFATDGRAMAQAQLLMREKFAIDAITACSDAFRISADLGGEMIYPESKPPYLAVPLVRSEGDLGRLVRPDVSKKGMRMADRAAAVKEMIRAVGNECLVLGWVDMPFAEACSVCGVSEFMMLLFEDPILAHRILELLTQIVIDFSLIQLEAGAPMIGAGDAVASLISPKMYREFALPYEQRVCEAVHNRGGLVKLHICGNTSALLNDMINSDADLFNVDHLVDFGTACDVYGKAGKCFKGNLDPVGQIMQAEAEKCERLAMVCMKRAEGNRYMLSAGCEIPMGVSDEVLDRFCRSPLKYAQEQG